MKKELLAVWLLISGSVAAWAHPEAVEIGKSNTSDLPRGKEADGIIGDFVLRNDHVAALISGNLPLRRANMSTFYGPDGITPGCLYDLTPRGLANDQITIFSPAEQRGPVSYVRILPATEGAAAIETVISAASNDGVFKRHEYRLEENSRGVLITTTLRNDSKQPRLQKFPDRWTTFSRTGKFGPFHWADAVDPADRAGYAYIPFVPDRPVKNTNDVELRPGEELIIRRFLAVGRSPAEAIGHAAAAAGETGALFVELRDGGGKPVPSATVFIGSGKDSAPAYPDENGRIEIPFPTGRYQVRVSDLGREPIVQEVELLSGESARALFTLSERPLLSFNITDESGQDIPCKVQFIGTRGTPSPNLGPANRARGCKDQYHSETGAFTTALPPGSYRIIVTRGIEYSHLTREVSVAAGDRVEVSGQLKRLVDTRGWVSADYHNHSTPSGDNTCGTDDRIINLAAEHIEFAPTTEHNRLYDWRPHIERLGLAKFLNTVSGMELTGSGPHLNSFPFHPHPHQQDGGAPVWNRDPRISAVLLRDHQTPEPDRWIQINHPDLVENFIDKNGDGLADGGYMGLGQLIDAVEVQNFRDSTILGPPVFIREQKVYPAREFLWLQLLNRGHRLVGMAVADAHSVHGNGVGGWRMYMPSKSDAPAEIDWRENSRHAKAGRSILTTGPFLEVETAEGAGPGADLRASGGVTLRVKVQCTDWIDINRVQVLVNGRQVPALNFTREKNPEMFKDGVLKFEQSIRVPLAEDAHLIVVAHHNERTLALGYGTSDQAALRPIAFNNPIFVDVDGGGFKPNGDMLGYPLGLGTISLEEAQRLIGTAPAPR